MLVTKYQSPIPNKVFIIQHGILQVLDKETNILCNTYTPLQTTRTKKEKDEREEKCHVLLICSRENVMVDIAGTFFHLISMII